MPYDLLDFVFESNRESLHLTWSLFRSGRYRREKQMECLQMCQKLLFCSRQVFFFLHFNWDFFWLVQQNSKWCSMLVYYMWFNWWLEVRSYWNEERERQKNAPWLGAIGFGFIYDPTTFCIFYILFHCRSYDLVVVVASICTSQSTATPDRFAKQAISTHAPLQLIQYASFIYLHLQFIIAFILDFVFCRCDYRDACCCSDWSKFNELNMNYALSVNIVFNMHCTSFFLITPVSQE